MTGIYEDSRAVLYADVTCEICQVKAIRNGFCLEQIGTGEAIEMVVKRHEQMRSVAGCVTEGGHCIEFVQRIGDRYHLLIRKQL